MGFLYISVIFFNHWRFHQGAAYEAEKTNQETQVPALREDVRTGSANA